jgi:carboxyl-terminal processing protease
LASYHSLSQLADVVARVKADYVEDVPEERLVAAAIRGMLTSLDRHSTYLSPQRSRNLKYQAFGEFGGVGVEIEPTDQDHLMRVITPIDDTPAHKAGIKTGDLITHIDGISISSLDFDEAVDKLRGPENSEITLKVRRGNNPPTDIKIKRALIRVQSVRWRVEENIGYVRITVFNNRTENSVKDAVTGIKDALGKDLAGIVLDLRNNGGGMLDQAIKVSDAFLNSGEILSTRGRDGRVMDRFFARPGDLAQGIPLIVLINKGSASAAEIVAGALQDNHRGLVLGEASCGKGSVQKTIPLANGGALRLTISRYYTPSGREIQGRGIIPNILVKEAVVKEVEGEWEREKDLPRSLPSVDGMGDDPLPNGTHFKVLSPFVEADYQLRRAVDLLMAKKFFKSFSAP